MNLYAKHSELVSRYHGLLEQPGSDNYLAIFNAFELLQGVSMTQVKEFARWCSAGTYEGLLGDPDRFEEGFQLLLHANNWTKAADPRKLNLPFLVMGSAYGRTQALIEQAAKMTGSPLSNGKLPGKREALTLVTNYLAERLPGLDADLFISALKNSGTSYAMDSGTIWTAVKSKLATLQAFLSPARFEKTLASVLGLRAGIKVLRLEYCAAMIMLLEAKLLTQRRPGQIEINYG